MTETFEGVIAERDYLKRELGLAVKEDERIRLQSRLGLTPSHAKIVLALLGRNGRPMTKELVMDLLYGDRATEPGDQIVNVMVHGARKKLGEGVIANIPGRGYFLTPAGVEVIRQALTVDQ